MQQGNRTYGSVRQTNVRDPHPPTRQDSFQVQSGYRPHRPHRAFYIDTKIKIVMDSDLAAELGKFIMDPVNNLPSKRLLAMAHQLNSEMQGEQNEEYYDEPQR